MLDEEVRTQMDQELAGPLPDDAQERDAEIRRRIAAAEQVRIGHEQQRARDDYDALRAAGIPEETARRLSGFEEPE